MSLWYWTGGPGAVAYERGLHQIDDLKRMQHECQRRFEDNKERYRELTCRCVLCDQILCACPENPDTKDVG